jgi:hypothetical protein
LRNRFMGLNKLRMLGMLAWYLLSALMDLCHLLLIRLSFCFSTLS